MKIVTVLGARPQFIKAAPVSEALRASSELVEVLVHTGQHYDDNMSDLFFEELGIPQPHFHLGIGSGSHGAQTGRMLEAVERVLVEQRPDCVLVYGDTNSTLAGALAAAKLNILAAHVEAGLRSFNRRMPEEINRILTDHCCNLLFAPTPTAAENLLREGLPEEQIYLVGDVMYDAALSYAAEAQKKRGILKDLSLEAGSYVLATVHRAENTDEPKRLSAIFQGLGEIARDLPVILPLHPRTREALSQTGLLTPVSRTLTLIEPVGYLDMLGLERQARLIATDSGGVQKEAFFHRVPCVILRDETEWVELIELGWNRLAPPLAEGGIARTIRAALAAPEGRPESSELYGGGKASHRIANIIATAELG